LPERHPYPDTEPNSDSYTNGYAQHDADTDDNANSQPDYYAERYTQTNPNTSTYPNTKTASYPAGLASQRSITATSIKIRMRFASSQTSAAHVRWQDVQGCSHGRVWPPWRVPPCR